MKFKIISCINKKLCIGKNNSLLYRIPNDLANFKRMTTGNVVIMGRKTFESLPGKKPLSNRVNIILTTDESYKVDGDNVYVVGTVAEVISLCEKKFSDKICFVIGGTSLYEQFLAHELIDEMYITIVEDDADGDAYFPNVFSYWNIFYESSMQSSKESINYKFIIYKRK